MNLIKVNGNREYYGDEKIFYVNLDQIELFETDNIYGKALIVLKDRAVFTEETLEELFGRLKLMT